MSMHYRVLVIGLGRIGMGYDLEKDKANYVLSHARAFEMHQSFQLAGAVDPDPAKRKLFEEHFKCSAFSDLDSGMRTIKPDIVVVATPTAQHVSTVKQVLALGKPHAILCEKPLASSLSDALEMLEHCRQKECALYVNYMRCADVTVAEIKKRLDTQTILTPLRGNVWYSKGLYNSASHFVNLLPHLLGEVIDVSVIAKGNRRTDQDPEPDFRLKFLGGEMYFLAVGNESLFHNTMEWIAPNGRLRYERAGALASWEAASSDAVYAGYTVIGTHAEQLPSDFQRVQWHVADQLAMSLAGNSAQICTGEEALRTMEIITRIEESI